MACFNFGKTTLSCSLQKVFGRDGVGEVEDGMRGTWKEKVDDEMVAFCKKAWDTFVRQLTEL